MKKNGLALVAALLAVVSLVLGIMAFVKTQKIGDLTTEVDELSAKNDALAESIEEIASKVNVEVDTSAGGGDDGLSIEDMEKVEVEWSEKQTYNLKDDGSGKASYAMMKGYSLYLDKNADDFSDIKSQLSADHAQIDGVFSSVITSHTADEATQDVIMKEALKEINKLLKSKAAVKLVLNGYVTQ